MSLTMVARILFKPNYKCSNPHGKVKGFVKRKSCLTNSYPGSKVYKGENTDKSFTVPKLKKRKTLDKVLR